MQICIILFVLGPNKLLSLTWVSFHNVQQVNALCQFPWVLDGSVCLFSLAHFRGSQGAQVTTRGCHWRAYLPCNTFWGIRLDTSCANAQSRSHSLLLHLSPLALGTCSTSYTMSSTGVVRWAVGFFFPYLSIFPD